MRARAFTLLALVACADPSASNPVPAGTIRGPTPAEQPARVSVAGGHATLGFAIGVERIERDVSAFAITRFPITVAQLAACVDAGACTAPSDATRAACGGTEESSALDTPTFGIAGQDDVPVTCVPPLQAAAYCKWVGGRIPAADEWIVAARGLSIRTHPWGEDPTDCARHTSPEGLLASPRSCCADGETCNVTLLARVGTHAAGASPVGIEDVLASPGELALPLSDLAVGACAPSGSACVVTGRHGAIEGARRFEPSPAGAGTVVSTTFRCRFEEPAQ